MCDLCKREVRVTNWFYVVECDTCNIPMVVSTEHRAEFSRKEKEDIKRLFGDQYNIRWEMRDIPNHAHCHLEAKT